MFEGLNIELNKKARHGHKFAMKLTFFLADRTGFIEIAIPLAPTVENGVIGFRTRQTTWCSLNTIAKIVS